MVPRRWGMLTVHLVHSEEQRHAPIRGPAGDLHGHPYGSARCADLFPGEGLCPCNLCLFAYCLAITRRSSASESLIRSPLTSTVTP